MIIFILHYLLIGILSTLFIDLVIRFLSTSEPYTPLEILLATIFWPFNVCIFIYAVIKSFFNL